MSQTLEEQVPKQLPTYIIVNDAPKLDLDSYIANYEGLTRLNRLQTIGASSRYLSHDALTLAISEARHGRNIEKYLEIMAIARSVAPSHPMVVEDDDWVGSRTKQVKAETDRLEHELKGYKNNLIKESIRMGNEELGAFYYATGDYAAAFKAYSRMREYCTTPKHIAEMSLKLILTAIAQENWMHVQSNIYKLGATTLKPTDKDKIEPIIEPLRGLATLASSNYRDAAAAFLAADPAYATLEPVAGISFPRSVLSPNDIAIYGALLSLATMSRAEIQLNVLENANFRTFLELEPHLRRAIADFCNSKYTACLAILESYRNDYLLDLYLQRHVGNIYGMIRRKSIVAFFVPFSRVSVAGMAEAFKTSAEAMTAELVEMIREGVLVDARVDVVDGMLVAKVEDRRMEVARGALGMAKKTERELRLRLWRVNMLEAGFEIQAPATREGKESMGMGVGGGRGMEMRAGGGGGGGMMRGWGSGGGGRR